MGGSSSSNQSAQSTSQQDNRRVYGQGAWSAENSNVTIQSLDANVANAAFASNNNAISNAAALIGANDRNTAALVSNTTANAFNFGTNTVNAALESNNATTSQAFGFANNTADSAFGFGNHALAYGSQATSQALDFGTAAFDFGSKAQAQANTALANESSLIASAYSDAKTQSGTTNKIMIGALVMAGLVAISALRK